MNTEEIDKLLRKICGDVFIGVFAKDQLPVQRKRPTLIVVNTDPSGQPGTHWIAMYIDKYGEYFDSLGDKPNTIFEAYMNKHCEHWIYNDKQVQSVTSKLCGHFCVFYCIYKSRGFDLRTIVSWFTTDYGLNDVLVHEFVCRRLMN
jgi:hypothetical protein